jgi:tRNA threonylcarbamoyl adenosine modification protein (Sua5/YciO/YrdC/YwlC family)
MVEVEIMLIKLYNENPNIKDITKVVHILKDGGIIIYPTDTVYAMGCDALNVRAVEKICKIKGINPTKSNLSIICPDMSNISEYGKVTNQIFKLMKRNLPGPFTFILNATNNLPKIYKNRKEVGIRIPDNNIILTLVKELGNPILTTSVRDRDDILEYCTDPELIDEAYGDKVDAVIDGGYGGIEPSTIVDCTGETVLVSRQGKGVLRE